MRTCRVTPLHETIPGFHDTPSRFAALERATQADPRRRTAEARREIECAFLHRSLAGVLLDLHKAGEIPERVVHNDAKISNVLFDGTTGAALCVVDLDTVMPGLAVYDFGDMVRSMTCPAAEDETDLSRVEVQMPLFEALARGYLEAATFLTPAERVHLVTAGKLITLEQGVRFLTDFLNGDTYYRTQRSSQNLDRCRTQFKLAESIIQNEAQMVRFVDIASVFCTARLRNVHSWPTMIRPAGGRSTRSRSVNLDAALTGADRPRPARS